MNKVPARARARYTPTAVCSKLYSFTQLVFDRIGKHVVFSIAPERYAGCVNNNSVDRQGYFVASWSSEDKEATVQQSPATAAAIETS